ncbi:CHASE2 domain-containing sensor protein [Arthrobacter roseus]|nr:CHASE2 domain-containing sensor protein [Arthrobacter roseus]
MVLSDADHKDSKSIAGPVKQRLRWPLAICILLIGAANGVLILVSAPVWARLIPVWVGLVILIALLAVILSQHAKRSGIQRRGSEEKSYWG